MNSLRCVRRIILVLACFFLLAATSSVAQTLLPPGVLEYEDAEFFRPTTDGGDFLTVYDSQTLDTGRFSLGFWGDYANDPIEIQTEDGDRFSRLARDLGTLQLTGSVGVVPSFHVGLRVPLYIEGFEHLAVPGAVTLKNTQANFGDLTANAKVTLLQRSRYGLGLAVVPEFTLPTGNRREFAGTGKFGFGGLLVADTEPIPNLILGLNLGGVTRTTVNDQLRAGAGLAYSFTPSLTGIVESYTAASTDKPFKEEFLTPADILGALRFGLGPVDLTFGGGAGLTRGRASPDFRFFLGITTPKPGLAPPPPRPYDGPNLARSRKAYAILNRDEDVRATPGDIVEYRITLVNSGDQPATNVVVEDPIPAKTTYVPGSLILRGQPLTDAGGDDAGQFLTAPVPTVMFLVPSLDYRSGKNEVTLSFQVEIAQEITEVTTIVNQAKVKADRVPEMPLPPTETIVYPRLKEVVVTPDKLVLKSNIHFEFDRAKVRADSESVLDEIVSVLRTYPDLRIKIEGHTDAVGTKQYNQKLSDQRALVVHGFILARGIAAERMEWIGLGEGLPIADNTTPLGRAKNRRMEFLVLNQEALQLDPQTEVAVEPTPYEPDLALESEPSWLKGKELNTQALRRRAKLDE